MPDQKDIATSTPSAGERSNLQPCPQCGGRQAATCEYVMNKGYIISLQCSDGCGYRRVV